MATQHRARASLGLVAACILLLIATACGSQAPQNRFVFFPRPAPASPAVEDPPPADAPPDSTQAEVADAPALSGPVPQVVRVAVPAPRPLAGLP